MHRAFPTLSPTQAERLVEGLDGISQTLIHRFAYMAAEPVHGPEIPGYDAILQSRFVNGNEPLPNLETAEYVRQALRRELFDTTKLLLDEMGRVAQELAAGGSRKVLAHKRRYVVWHIAGGDLSARDLSKRVATALEGDCGLREHLEFSAIEGDAATRRKQKAERGKIIRNLLSEMRAAARRGEKPYLLSAADETVIREVMETVSAENKGLRLSLP